MLLPRRRFLAGSAALAAPALVVRRASAATDIGPGLRENIEHIVVIFQENRSFDHYFGTYEGKSGHKVNNLLDAGGRVDPRYLGLQKNPAGIAYDYLPVPADLPTFQDTLLENMPFHLAPYLPPGQNIPWDPVHEFYRMYAQMDGGRMDRFVALALGHKHPPFAAHGGNAVEMEMAESRPSGAVIGHYNRADIPDYHALADDYVLFDDFYQAMSGGSTGNALYLVAAHSAVWPQAPHALMGSLAPPVFGMLYDSQGALINDISPLQGPTGLNPRDIQFVPPPHEQTYPNIGDRLSAASIPWAWYNEGWDLVKPWAMKRADGPGDGSMVLDSGKIYEAHHNPFQYYPSWYKNVEAGHIRDATNFFDDARADKLPAVSFIKASGAHDEHPADSAPQWGMDWVMSLLKAVAAGKAWNKTLVVITYDEGGGFWDHVAPPVIDAFGPGTRIPALLVSAWARPGYVDHKFAHTGSVLRLIEERFGIAAMQARDANAYNLTDGLDFSQSPRPLSFG